MTYDEIVGKLYDLLRAMVAEVPELHENMELAVDLGLDSLAVMRLLEAVEDEFDISIPLNVLSDVRTVKDFALQLQHIVEKES
ncbi:MAG: acyl carrier protein [Deltaproteobacteria bacterium]|nr:acyl carrier protein [Candidatus Anaeroferrophillus wilburensis]MBN2889919.1 acyl carrier protein [Deltaproteobacteria bacterium]